MDFVGLPAQTVPVDRALIPGFGECESRKTVALAAAAKGDYSTASRLLRMNLDWCKSWLSTDPVDEMTMWHRRNSPKL